MSMSTSFKFLNSQDMQKIDEYLKNNIVFTYKEKYRDFVPYVAEKVESICQKIYKDIAFHYNRGKFRCSFYEAIDKNLANLIGEFFHSKFNLAGKITNLDDKNKNEIDTEILAPCSTVVFEFIVTPKSMDPATQQLIPYSVKRYNFDSSLNGKMLYTFAKNATETDVALISAEGDKIPAHKLILKT